MIKFDYSFEEAQRMAKLEDERGAIGDPHSIGGYAQALKRARSVAHEPQAAAASPPQPCVRRTIGSLSRRGIRYLAMANAEVRA